MTVTTLVSSASYIGNGVSTIFTYPFYVIDALHLQVWVNGLLQPTSAYTVNSVGNLFGGEVVLVTAPLVGQQVDLKRSVPATQLVDYRPYDPFPAETHEQALDKLTMIVQGHSGLLANAVRTPYLETPGSFNMILPAASVRANLLLGFDATGNVITYPFYGPPPDGITDHGMLSGLVDDDHPQYMLRTELGSTYLPLTGGTMTGAIQLPLGFPAAPTEAVNKAYVDTFVGSVITKNIISDATGDSLGTIAGAWNAQANALGITRASNEIIYYRWKSDDAEVYRYVGDQQGPSGWATVAQDWAASGVVNEAPLDGFIYGRRNASWDEVVARSGGSYLGKVQVPAGAAAPADLARTDEVQALVDAGLALHISALNPHPQYMLKSGGVITGQSLFADGTVAAPGISWASDTDSGWHRAANSEASYSVNAADKFLIGPARIISFAPHYFAAGSQAAPSIAYLNQPNVGLYFTGNSNIAFSYGNVPSFEGGNHFTVHTGMTVVGALNAASMSSTTISGNFSVTGTAGIGALTVYGATDLQGTTNLRGTGITGNLYVNGRIDTAQGSGFPSISVTGRIAGGEHVTAALGAWAQTFIFNAPGSTDFHYDGGISIYHQVSGVQCWYTNSGGHVVLVPLTAAGSSAFNGAMTVNNRINVVMNGSGASTGYGSASILINSTAGGYPALGFHEAGVVGWNVYSQQHLWTGCGTGPSGLGGANFAISKSNGVYAFYYNVINTMLTASAPMTGSLARILKLRGVRGVDAETKQPAIRVNLDELELEFPELVSKIEGNGATGKGINYMALAAPIIEAIRELNNRITALEAR